MNTIKGLHYNNVFRAKSILRHANRPQGMLTGPQDMFTGSQDMITDPLYMINVFRIKLKVSMNTPSGSLHMVRVSQYMFTGSQDMFKGSQDMLIGPKTASTW
jgi:hypothetical protein